MKVLLVWNIIVFLLYGADKYKAKHGGRRISERALLLSALFLGGIGAMLGMELFRHKTKHTSFRIAVPLSFVLTALFILWGMNII